MHRSQCRVHHLPARGRGSSGARVRRGADRRCHRIPVQRSSRPPGRGHSRCPGWTPHYDPGRGQVPGQSTFRQSGEGRSAATRTTGGVVHPYGGGLWRTLPLGDIVPAGSKSEFNQSMKGHFVFWKRVDARREGAVEADDSEARRAHAFLRSLQGYEVTPLLRHSGLAAALDVAEVLWKDEGRRWRVGSFKALGAAYATSRLVRDGSSASRTVCCATDGNHGRAVAWAARRLGYHAMVYLPEHATAARERRIRAFGATVVRVPGTYDDAVSEASRAAAEHDWVLVSDTAGDATDSRGSLVIAAYTLIVQEIADTLQRFPQPTHVFVQAGVGGLAAAMTWWCRQVWPDVPPTIVVVEPLQAACVGVSLAKGRPMPVEGPLQTVADCLSAGKVSERGMADPPKRGGRGGSRRRR